jgi:hypothetical protein
MGKAHPSLLGHLSSDGTATAGRLPIAIEGHKLIVQRCIVVVVGAIEVSLGRVWDQGEDPLDFLGLAMHENFLPITSVPVT